jgi:ABC-type transport system substrate-binding protein
MFRILKPKFLVFLPLVLILVAAMACGEDPTPTPRPTATAVPPTAVPATAVPATAVPATAKPAPTAVPAAKATPVPAATEAPAKSLAKHGGVVPMVMNFNPGIWDPHGSKSIVDLWSNNFPYNQLLEYSPLVKGEIIGDLAESWTAAADGKSVTFVLRDDPKWEDGKDVTADDVVFSIERVLEPGRVQVGILKNYVVGAEALDPRTVKINLKFPSLGFLTIYASDYQKVLPKHYLETGVDLALFGNSMGSGPWKDVSFQSDENHELVRNPNYFKAPRPYFDGIKRYIITDGGTEAAAFKSERILMSQAPISRISIASAMKLEEEADFASRFTVHYYPGVGVDSVVLNGNKEPFSSPLIRKAFFLAIHRQPLVEGLGRGKFTIGKPMSPSNSYTLSDEEVLKLPGYRELNGKKHPDDIAEAQRLMAEAGFPGGKGFKADFIAPVSEAYEDAAVAIKEQLKDTLGVELEVRALPSLVFREIMASDADLEIAFWGQSPGNYDPDDRFFQAFTDNPYNHQTSRVSDPAVEEIFAKVREETDVAKRTELAKEMQRILLTGAPGTIDIFWKSKIAIVHNRIKSEIGDYVVTLARVGLKHEHEWLAPE